MMSKVIIAIFLITTAFGGYSYFDNQNKKVYVADSYEPKETKESIEEDSATEQVVAQKEVVTHLETPQPLKSIYMTACVLATPSFRRDLVQLIEETEINAVIIDIKDYTGTVSFKTDNPKIYGAHHGDGCQTKDTKEFIEELHAKGIYVMGRVSVFQDNVMTKLRPDLAVKRASDGGVWKDGKGIGFIDVGAKEHWDYMIDISKEAYALGYDEINFDYVRYPSDGNMKDIHFEHSDGTNKPKELEKFFAYLYEELKDTGIVTSADLFGMVTTNTDDLNIGQVLELALPYFDYIAPMVYPSHYPPNFNGWANPNHYPYELIYFVMKSGVTRAEALKNNPETPLDVRQRVGAHQLRTWIQDFNYGSTYGPKEVRAQIDASVDAGVPSWMIWAPSNRYTRGALLDN